MLEISQESDQGTILKATGSWTIDQARGIWTELKKHLNGNLAIDLQGIDRMDSSGFQLLITAKAMSQKSGNICKLLNHSLLVLKMMDLAGVLGSMRDQVRISASNKEALQLTYSRNRYSI